MPNYKGRKPGTRRVIISIKGQRPREKVIRATAAEAKTFEAQWLLELQTSSVSAPIPPPIPKFYEICKAYSVHAESHLKASTWKDCRVYEVARLAEVFGQLPCDALTMAHVDAFKRAQLEKRQASSVNRNLIALSAVLSWARLAGYDVPNLKWKKLPVRKSDRVQFWTEVELQLIFDACRTGFPDLLPMLIFLANTGCRKGESVAANWDWLKLDDGLITIPANECWQPKSGRSRDIPLSDSLRAALSGPRRHPVVMFPAHGKRRYAKFPGVAFARILKAAGCVGSPHRFRHTFASMFLAEMPNMPLLAEILGHSTTRITELYAHLLPGKLDRARNVVNVGVKVATVSEIKQA